MSSLFVFLHVFHTDVFNDERKSPPLPYFKLFSVESYSQRAISNFTSILLEISTVPILCWKFIVAFWHRSASFSLSTTLFVWRDHHLLVKKSSRLALWTRQERQVVPQSGLTQGWWVPLMVSRVLRDRGRHGFSQVCHQNPADWHHSLVQVDALRSVMSKYTILWSMWKTGPQLLVHFTTGLSYPRDFASSALAGSNGICECSAPGRLWLHAGTHLTLFSLEKAHLASSVLLMGFKSTLTPASF